MAGGPQQTHCEKKNKFDREAEGRVRDFVVTNQRILYCISESGRLVIIGWMQKCHRPELPVTNDGQPDTRTLPIFALIIQSRPLRGAVLVNWDSRPLRGIFDSAVTVRLRARFSWPVGSKLLACGDI